MRRTRSGSSCHRVPNAATSRSRRRRCSYRSETPSGSTRARRPAPSRADLDERPAEDRGNEPAADTPASALARLALAGGTFLGRPFTPREQAAETMDRKESRIVAKHNGFAVHCAVRIAAGNDEGRERLIRSFARPPFALDRIEELKDGRIAYLVKTPRRGGTHRLMTPVELMGRLAILVPPPYFPLVRYHGVLAARSSWRALVTPKPPDGVARRKKLKACPKGTDAKASPTAKVPATGAPPPAPPAVPAHTPPPVNANGAANAFTNVPNALPSALAPTALPLAAAAALLPMPAPPAVHAVPVAFTDPTVITVSHWNRILDGALYAASSRVEWAVLLQRTYGFEALRCPKCAARMRVMATITDPSVVKKILSHLNVRTEPLPRARARDPTGQESFDYDAA